MASPRNSTTSTSRPYFLKIPFSMATYGVIESSDGGLREEPSLILTIWASPKEGTANRNKPKPIRAILCVKRVFIFPFYLPYLMRRGETASGFESVTKNTAQCQRSRTTQPGKGILKQALHPPAR